MGHGRAMATGPQSHQSILAKLEKFVAARSPVYVSELCGATGISESTLRRRCREHLGMGPMRYLWLRRMDLARHALSRARPASTTVQAVARDRGFRELGRFSVEYRLLFVESPSATLGRLPNRARRTRSRHRQGPG
jgi:AraC-like DNA-binding protein